MSKMETRMMTFQVIDKETDKRIESDYYVEGYATTFAPYQLYTDYDGKPINEVIEKGAFNNTITEDVILQYDHEGRVYARQSNGTLGLEVDDKGLFIWADLSKTENARNLYEDIKAGMVTQMSWRFTVAPNGDYYDEDTRTIHIRNVSKIYDVSAVSIPANNQTVISARSKALVDTSIKKKKLELKLKLRK